MDIYYINGKFVASDDSSISVHDLTFLRGFSVFDFLRTYNSKPFYLKEHVERLKNSAALLGIPFKWDIDDICNLTVKTLSKNSHMESNIRIIITGGISLDSISQDEEPSLLILVTNLHEMPEIWYKNGVKVIISRIDRYQPYAKSTNYTSAIIALNRAKKESAIESLYMNNNNHVLEGTTSNYFIIKNNMLITPEKKILSGITRKSVLKITKKIINIDIRSIKKDEIYDADEIFLTASNKEIVPVVKVDNHTVGNGKPGEKTKKVMNLFKEYTTQYGLNK